MEYRDLCGKKVSLLGFGCMRFPTEPDGTIDELRAGRLIDTAVEAGINYFDTAYPYHDRQSEPFLGRALRRHDRRSLNVATKLTLRELLPGETPSMMLERQLERLNTDYIDFYLLHALNREKWIEAQPMLDELFSLRKKGTVRHLGFSFHDSFEVFEEILSSRKWDFCQIQYNYMDTDIQAGTKGYELAASRSVPVIVMEPVKGGALASLPEEVCVPLREAAPEASCASWALRWVASHENVRVVLSGMSDESQLEDNLKTFGRFKPLSSGEQRALETARSILKSRAFNGCTGCGYCMPCPNGVNIPGAFRAANRCAVFGGDIANAVNRIPAGEAPGQCLSCGQCLSLCPQGVDIVNDLQRLRALSDR